jgi:hypothetical protein
MSSTFVLISKQEWPSRDEPSHILEDRTIINPSSFLSSIELPLYAALSGWWKIIFSMGHIHQWDRTPAISLTDIDSCNESFYWWCQCLGQAKRCLWLSHGLWCLFDFVVRRIHCIFDAHVLFYSHAKDQSQSNRIEWTISQRSNKDVLEQLVSYQSDQ